MEWPFKDPDFDDRDLEHVLSYGAGQSIALLRNCGSQEVQRWELDTDEDWQKWLNENPLSLPLGRRSGHAVILAARAERTGTPNGATLQELPLSKDIFGRIIQALPLHGETAIVLNRSVHATFTDIDLRGTKWDAIFYCCRTTSKYPGDLAISSVFYPSSGFTAAVFLGCHEGLTRDITNRLRVAENCTSHPLLVLGMLVEIERKRHLRLVDSLVYTAINQIYSSRGMESTPTASESRGACYLLDSWFAITQLRSELETWKLQLGLMIEHVNYLERDIFAEPGLTNSGATRTTRNSLSGASTNSDSTLISTEIHQHLGCKPASLGSSWSKGNLQVPEDNWKQHGRDTGKRMKKRLRVIVNDYDKQIRECTMAIEGLQLDTQMPCNQIGYKDAQTNLRIARDTRRDSGQMRSIAMLTMIFLPATFVSSIFSMTFFNWHPDAGEEIVSPYAWIYPVVAMFITAVVLAVWWIKTRKRQTSVSDGSDVEMDQVRRR